MEAGIAEEDLRLVIVHDLALGQDHAIVAARLGQDWIMLDNRWLTLVQDVKMRRVVPLVVLDRDGLRQFSHEKTYSNSAMPFGNVAGIRKRVAHLLKIGWLAISTRHRYRNRCN